MKKVLLTAILLVSIFVTGFTTNAAGNISVVINKEEIVFDVPPVMESGRTLVPMRDIFECLGADVQWNAKDSTVKASKDKLAITIKIGKKEAFVNEKKIMLDAPAKIIRSTTMVPLRFVSEALGAEVSWDKLTRTVSINFADPEEVRGNTFGNNINSGYAAPNGDFTYASLVNFGLCRISKDGSERKKISKSAVSNLNIAGDFIFYSNGHDVPDADKNRLYRIKTDGTGLKRLTKDEAEYVCYAGDWIYYLNTSEDSIPYRIKPDGQFNQKISDISMKSMTVEKGWIYYVGNEDESLYRMRINGNNIKKLSGNESSQKYFTKSGDYIYYIVSSTGIDDEEKPSGIYKVKKDGSISKLFIKGSYNQINSSDGFIYYTDFAGNLFKTKEDGSQKKKVARDINSDISISNGWVYYTKTDEDMENFEEYRVKNDGSVKQRLDKEGPLTDISLGAPEGYTYVKSPITLPVTSQPAAELTVKDIARKKDAVAFIKIFDDNGKQMASGSGFNIESSGIVVTNYHVIKDAVSVKCTLGDKVYEVESVLCHNSIRDLAVLKLKGAKDLPVLRLGDSDKLENGEDVVAIGNPMELQNSVTKGIVSAIRPYCGLNFIQTDTPISPGSSGGPLFNMYGDVIGLTTMSYFTFQTQNLNFAIPVNDVKKILGKAASVPLTYASFAETEAEETEDNDSIGTANALSENTLLTGSFEDSKDQDYYKFTLDDDKRISFFGNFESYSEYGAKDKPEDTAVDELSISIVDENGKEIAKSDVSVEWETKIRKISTQLKKGTYYLLVKRTSPAKKDFDYEDYSITVYSE